MDNITKLYTKDAAKDPDVVLERAVGSYDDVILLGWDKEGLFDPRASLGLDHKEILWLLELFKQNLLSGMYNDG